MMTTTLFTVTLVLLSAYVQGQNIVDAKCRTDRPIFQNFDVQKYLGKWFEIYRYEQRFSKDCNCVNAIYTLNEDNSVKVNNCCSKVSGNICNEGRAILSKPEAKEGKLSVSFFVETSPRYTILDTDYDNFAIIFDCVNTANHLPVDALWVNSRTPQLNPAIKAKVEGMLDEYFNRTQFIITNQEVEKCSAISWMPPMNHQPL
ncbi:unnamed protein product [Diamesa hyperborea]